MRSRKRGRVTCSNTDVFLVMSFQGIISSDEFPSLRSTILNVDGTENSLIPQRMMRMQCSGYI